LSAATESASLLMPRRFPPPWTVEELDACFVVIDSAEQKLAYVYFEEESGRRSAAKLLTKDEARRIAANIAKPAVAQVLNRELQKQKEPPRFLGGSLVCFWIELKPALFLLHHTSSWIIALYPTLPPPVAAGSSSGVGARFGVIIML
jgi:hypothetical protein